MLFEVEHTTRFDYSQPVTLEPMTVRLRPRAERSQRLHRFQMHLDPEPAGRTEATDLEGNDTTLVWFSGPLTHLEVRTTLLAETLRSNPYDYLVLDPAALELPMRYPDHESVALQRYRTPSGDPEVIGLAAAIMQSAKDAPDFLSQLGGHLAAGIEAEVRLEGDPLPPSETLERGKGSCRDVAVLFADVCRSVGLAARFVSGYQEGDPDIAEKYLHAWSEVYLSGVGWRGYDPTLGLAVSDRHLVLATGPSAYAAAPTEGSYRGAADSSIKGHLEVRVTPSEAPESSS